jgi:hypothetical protein
LGLLQHDRHKADVQAARNTQPMLSHINISTGEDLSIRELAMTVCEVNRF